MKRVLAALAAFAIVGACDTTSPRVPAAVEVDQQNVAIGVGQTITASAVVLDQHGRAYETPPEGFTITWTSSDESIAQVQEGVISGLASGAATVTARAGDLPPADILVQVEGTLDIADGVFDLPVLVEGDSARNVDADIGFVYSRHATGSFALSETYHVSDISADGSYAWTFHNLEYNDHDFVAWQQRPDGTLDYMEFYVDGGVAGPGTYPVYLAFFVRGLDVMADTFETYYLLDTSRGHDPGSVTVTSIDDQVTGSFAMSMEAHPATAAGDGAAARSGARDAGFEALRRALRPRR